MNAVVEPTFEQLDAFTANVNQRLIEGSRQLHRALWQHHPAIMRALSARAIPIEPKLSTTREKELRAKERAEQRCIRALEQASESRRSREALEATVKRLERSKVFEVQVLIADVCLSLGIEPRDFVSRKRTIELVDARAIVASILQQRGWSYNRIARAIGRTDHSTALHAVEHLDIYLKRNPAAAKAYADACAKYVTKPEWAV